MSAFLEFGFGSGDRNIGIKSEKFKGETGRSYRLSFAWWPGVEDGTPDLTAKTPRFVGAKRFYFEGVGYVIDGGAEFSKLAGQASRMAIATIMVVWPINQDGTPDMGRVKAKDFKVLPWIFSEDKYKSFTPIHREFPFGSHDVTVNCSDSKYQKMTFAPCKDSLLQKLSTSDKETAKDVTEFIVERVQLIAGKIKDDLGRELSIDQLRDKLAGGGGIGSIGNVNAATAATTVDIDNLVDDVLG